MDKYRAPSGSSTPPPGSSPPPHAAVTKNSSCAKGVGMFGCGCAVLGVLVFAGIAGFVFFIGNIMKKSEPFRDSLAAVQSHPLVIESLGEPIKEGFFVTGSINTSGNTGDADMTYSISGPNGEGSVHVIATKDGASGWIYETCEATVPGRPKPIELKP